MKPAITLLITLIISIRIGAAAYPTAEAKAHIEKLINDVYLESTVNYSSDYAAASDSGEGEVPPQTSYFAVDEVITPTGSTWEQPSGYCAYRVWVENTESVKLTVYLTFPNGCTVNAEVPANSYREVFIQNYATSGTYKVDFMTSTGSFSGTVRVQVSDTAFPATRDNLLPPEIESEGSIEGVAKQNN